MSVDLEKRLASLPPEKRKLLELRLRKEGIAAERRPSGPPPVPQRDPEDPGPYPLSFGQQRLWFIEQLNPGSAAYNIPFAGRLRGRLDSGILERSLLEVARRHEVLRTRFLLRDGKPVQVVDPEPFVRLPVIDLTALPADPREAEAARIILAEPHAPFDLERGPVIRVSLVKLGTGEGPSHHVGTLRSQLPAMTGKEAEGGEEHALLVTMPHLITDAWSMGIFFRELPAIYEAFRRGETPKLPEIPVQMADYAIWQRGWLQGEVLEEQLRFWRDYLAGAPPVLALPTDHPRPPSQTFKGKRLPMALPPEVIRGLKAFNERHGVTSFMTFLAVLDVLLQRWSGLDDIVIGSPVVTRPQAETHPLIGFFLNMAVLRTRMEGDPTFEELLARVRDSALASLAHQDFPFERLTEVMEAVRDPSYPPLVQVSYVLQNVHIPQPDFEGIRLVDSWQTDTDTARFDLGLGVFEEEGDDTIPQGGFDYNTDLWDEPTILRMRGHFLALAAGALAEPGRRISELPMLSEAERRQLLEDWSATDVTRPEQSFLEIVEGFARTRPDAPALVGTDETVTYAELVRRVEELAAHLRSLGVGPEVGVAVCLERSPERVVAFLAALASGGFYLPLDPAWPAERREWQLRDAGVTVVVDGPLTPGPSPTALPPNRERGVPSLISGFFPLSRAGGSAMGEGVGGEGLAYVFYTSGFTGRPKGVMISRASLDNLPAVIGNGLGDAPGNRVLQVISPGFDASLMEIVTALAAGRALQVAAPGALLAGPELAAFAEERDATCGIMTPTALASVPEGGLAGVRCITLGGEALPPGLVERWAPGRRFFNVYGPTEATVCTTIGEVMPDGSRPSIGRPVAGARVYVLDRRLQPVPVSAHGELCVGGIVVGRGYLGRPDLTAERFVPDPFSGEPGARLYRSGDRVRHLPDGRLDFLGRLDEQIKVRGFRIEPGEIEAVLKEHPGVRDAAVVLREDRLLACLVGEVDQGALRSWLRDRLPEAMVPAGFAFLDALPLSPTGKLDRQALSRLEPEVPEVGEPEMPTSDKERLLAGIWAKALKLDSVGLHDDFFQIGGDSILAIQVVARAAEAGLYVEPRQLFESPTVAGMAAVAAGAPRTDAEQGPVAGPVPLTPIQRWFLEDFDPPVPHHWNLGLMLEVAEGVALDPARMARAVARLVEHHDQLRARFIRTGAGWRQEVAPPRGDAPFTLLDLSVLPEAVRESALKSAAATVQTGFQLDRGPLLRAALFDLGPDRPERLLLAVHHLVMDGVSWPILLADLRTAYDGLNLPPKTTSFQRWAERLREYARTAELRQELEYWRSTPSPAQRGRAGEGSLPLERNAARIELTLSPDETRQLLSEVPEASPVRVEEVLLAAIAEALADWRGERTLAIAVEGHGRERLFDDADLSRTVGWFTSTFPLWLDLGEGDALREVKERLRRVPRRGIGYGVLRYLADDQAAALLRDHPRPEVTFNYLGRADDPAAGEGPLRLAADPGGAASDPRNPRPHPLEIDAVVLRGELRLVWIYDRERYRPEAIERLATASLDRLRALIARCISGEASGHTAVDFPHAGLEQEQLDRLLGKIGRRS
ncbi:MAG TPA: amino acid adenylation domain-containing protein [Thermoanaerobaculia bacterium]|nr:amino acid adenylation domain-containing protein [Thermoanaerobaculia bacterium]